MSTTPAKASPSAGIVSPLTSSSASLGIGSPNLNNSNVSSPSSHPNSAQGGLSAAKARKAAREEAERVSRLEADELHSLKSYNEMLKNLLSKEINGREAAEQRMQSMETEMELFKQTELEHLRHTHEKEKAALEVQLYAKFKADHEHKVDQLVQEKVTALRLQDKAKYRDLNDVQIKLHAEFESKYSHRIAKHERREKEMNDQLSQNGVRVETLQSEIKGLHQTIADKDALVTALEYRCEKLEMLKNEVKSLRYLVKFLSCRIFVNTIRMKKGLQSVYSSLRVLHEKLNYDSDYDRTSEIILPQHELEVWLGKTHALLTKNRQLQQAHFNMIFAGTSQALVHPNTLVSAPHLQPPTGVSMSSMASSISSPRATSTITSASDSSETPSMASALVSLTPSVAGSSPSSDSITSTSLVPSSNFSVPSSPDSPTSKKLARHQPSIPGMPSGTQKFIIPFTGLSEDGTTLRAALKTDIPKFSLNYKEMLSCLSDVEIILRGCLIECLNKASEWKCSSEDFFARNQELVGEMLALREQQSRLQQENKALQVSLALVEKSLHHIQDERKALMHIDAQAPTSSLTATTAGLAGKGNTSTRSVTKRHGSSANSIPTGPISSGADLLQSTASSLLSSPLTPSPPVAGAPHATESATRAFLDSHARMTRLAQVDGTSPHAILALSSRDLIELARNKMRLHGPKGFFDHHSALIQVVRLQKTRLEEFEHQVTSLKQRLVKSKERYKELQARQVLGKEIGEKMDQEVDDKDELTETDDATELALEEAKENHAHTSLHASPASSPYSTYEDEKQPSATYRPSPPRRPGKLHVDEDDYGGLRPSLPFSPPVYPVSPYDRPVASSVSARSHSHSHSSSATTTPLPAASSSSVLRGPSLSMSVPPIRLRNIAHACVTPYEYTPTFTGAPTPASASTRWIQSARGAGENGTTSFGASLLKQSLISTSSPSYAGTDIYTPTPSTHHQSTKGAERVYGHGSSTDRPHTSDGRSSSPSSSRRRRGGGGGGSGSRTARTVNPLLLNASLTSPSTIAAALAVGATTTQIDAKNQITGDVRYDIISPYASTALPWERSYQSYTPVGFHRPSSSSSSSTTNHSHSSPAPETKKKPPVPRLSQQHRQRSKSRGRSGDEEENERHDEETGKNDLNRTRLDGASSPVTAAAVTMAPTTTTMSANSSPSPYTNDSLNTPRTHSANRLSTNVSGSTGRMSGSANASRRGTSLNGAIAPPPPISSAPSQQPIQAYEQVKTIASRRSVNENGAAGDRTPTRIHTPISRPSSSLASSNISPSYQSHSNMTPNPPQRPNHHDNNDEYDDDTDQFENEI